jgi:hypothetical protein
VDAGTNSVSIGHHSDDGRLAIFSNGSTPPGVVFNELGFAHDFRIESDSYQFLFCIDGTGNYVGIGDNSSNNAIAYFHPTAGVQINLNNADRDFNIEGNTLANMFFCDASAATENIALVATAAPNWQTMDRGLFLGNATTAPTGNPSNGVFFGQKAGN